MRILTKHKLPVALKPPSGKGSGRFANVSLCVLSAPEGEEFHHFPREIFIGLLFPVLLVIEKRQHGRCFRDLPQERTKIPQSMRADHIEQLLLSQRVYFPTGEMTVPEKRQFLPQLRRRGHHLLQPQQIQFLQRRPIHAAQLRTLGAVELAVPTKLPDFFQRSGNRHRAIVGGTSSQFIN